MLHFGDIYIERYGPCLHINDRVRTEILMSQEQTRDNHFGIFVVLLCFTSFFCVYLKWKGGNNVFKSYLIKKKKKTFLEGFFQLGCSNQPLLTNMLYTF